MAQKKRKGFKVAANYDPRRAPKRSKRGYLHGDAAPTNGKRGERGDRTDRTDRTDRNGRTERAERAGRAGGAARAGSDAHTESNARAEERGQAARPEHADRGRRVPRGARSSAHAGREMVTKLTTVEDAAGKTFADLGLGQNIVRSLAELGADAPFPIQVATIPDILAGRDVLGKAETGSGKTIAFGAALVERMLMLKAQGAFGTSVRAKKPMRGERMERGTRTPMPVRNPKALILAPTRELALQIDRTVQPIARSVGFYTAQLVGGVPIEPQVHALGRGIDIVIGTPGRIRDLVQRRKLDLREVVISVIDEADHLCELGFLEETQWTLRQTLRGGQRLLFSATLDRDVNEIVAEFLQEPAAHEIEKAKSTVPHKVYLVLREDKEQAVLEFARMRGRIMMFCRTRAYAELVTDLLTEAGIGATALHGNLSQARRERNLEKFSTGKARVLVATDVAARGIHVDNVDVVVQLDPPSEAKTFVHRSGRTGRAGSSGQVVTLIPRTWQKRTREMLAEAAIEPEFFGDYVPGTVVRGKSTSHKK